MPDPAEWAGDLSAESGSCLLDFDLFLQEMAKVYGDKDRRCVAVITLMQESIQLPEESVRAYTNRVKAIGRQAGCNPLKHDDVLYYIAWAGLRYGVKNTVGPMTPACAEFDSLKELLDKAEPSEVTHVEHKMPLQQQEQQQQQQQKQPIDSSSTGGKPVFRPSFSEPPDTTGSGKSGLSETNRHGKSCSRGQLSGIPACTLGLNENLRRPMFYWQMLTMRISELPGELLP